MPSKREEVLSALATSLASQLPTGAELSRNELVPMSIPSVGLVILRDGDPGEPEVTLSPLLYHYEHRAELDVIVEGSPAARDALFDALAVTLAAAIEWDRTLGGLCEWIEAEAPSPLGLAIEGGEGMKAATVGVVLHYTSPSPLG